MIKQFEDGTWDECEPTESTVFRRKIELLGLNNEASFEDLLECFPFGWNAGRVIADMQRKFLIVPKRSTTPLTPAIDTETEMLAAIRAWLKCPAEKRPSPYALGKQIERIASALSRPERDGAERIEKGQS